MALEVTAAGILAFVVTLALLLLYSIMDLQERRVPNRIMVTGFVIGLLSGLIFWHLIDQLLLHLTAVTVVVLVVFLLFKIGAVGGADAKSALTIAVISPGIEFGFYGNFLFEGVIGGTLQILVMLLLGYLYQVKMKDSSEKKTTPLIPFLLVGYLLVQLFAFV